MMKASCAKPSPVKHPAPDKTKQKQLPAGVQLVCGKTVSTFRRREFTQEDLPAEPIVLARLELDRVTTANLLLVLIFTPWSK